MLGEDDQTIATLRQAVARWEHGDQAGAQEVQHKIKAEQDSRELSRQLTHLQQTMKLREKQMADLRDELMRTQQQQQQQRQSSAASSLTAASSRQAAEQARNDEEIRAAQHRIAVLEREVNEQRHRGDVLQQRNDQLASSQHKRADEKDENNAAERKQLTDKISQLEHSQCNSTPQHIQSHQRVPAIGWLLNAFSVSVLRCVLQHSSNHAQEHDGDTAARSRTS